MNGWIKWGLVFTGGVALGALGAVAVSKGKINLRPLARDIVAGGMELKEKMASVMEVAKEHFEDIVAEAADAREGQKTDTSTTAGKKA